jgi:hypothetical protein
LQELVKEGEVDHAVGNGHSTAQAFQVFNGTPMHLGTSGDKRLGGSIRARKSHHLMARVD